MLVFALCAAVCTGTDWVLSAGNCSTCKTGFFLTTEETCAACADNCAQCSSATACHTCKTGFFVTKEETCAACADNCAKCSSATACSACDAGYHMSSNGKKCYENVANCEIYTDDGGCTTCKTGFIKKTDNTCAALNCDTHAGDGGCTTCKTGFVLKTAAKTCTACPANCASCQLKCIDTDNGAEDSTGDNCSWYSGYENPPCGSFDHVDFKSNDMCCACGGGSGVCSRCKTFFSLSTDNTTCAEHKTEDLANSGLLKKGLLKKGLCRLSDENKGNHGPYCHRAGLSVAQCHDQCEHLKEKMTQGTKCAASGWYTNENGPGCDLFINKDAHTEACPADFSQGGTGPTFTTGQSMQYTNNLQDSGYDTLAEANCWINEVTMAETVPPTFGLQNELAAKLALLAAALVALFLLAAFVLRRRFFKVFKAEDVVLGDGGFDLERGVEIGTTKAAI